MIGDTVLSLANRALQRVGAARIGALSDDSKNASEIGACYDTLRRAELRRNVWRFAIRRAVLRAVTGTTTLLAPVAYDAGTTYAKGAVVSDSNGFFWQSIVGSNLGNTPANDGGYWEAYCGPMTMDAYDDTVPYYAGELVLSSSVVYVSLSNGNLNNAPASGSPWLSLGAASSALTFVAPVGIGPLTTSATKVLYHLPAGFLRLAQQDQSVAAIPRLATTGGVRYSDWMLEGNYLVTSAAGPLIMRFGADVTWAGRFDALFFEALAARVSLELVQVLSQSDQKQQIIGQLYQRFVAEARKINLIEIGSAEPDEMDETPLFAVGEGRSQPAPTDTRGN